MFSETKKEIKDNFLKEAKRSAKGTKNSEKKKEKKRRKSKEQRNNYCKPKQRRLRGHYFGLIVMILFLNKSK